VCRGARRGSIDPIVSGSAAPTLPLKGRLIFAEAAEIWDDVRRRVDKLVAGERLDIDMSEVESIDGGTMALLVHIRGELAGRGGALAFPCSWESPPRRAPRRARTQRALAHQQNSDNAGANGQYGIAGSEERKAEDAHHKAAVKAIDEGKRIPPFGRTVRNAA
jgi:ABC-type transporter Mla MlaB component